MLKIENKKIYVIYDKKAKTIYDCFVDLNPECALRFMSIRVRSATESKNYPILSIWGDSTLYEIDLSGDVPVINLVSELAPIIPNDESGKNENN